METPLEKVETSDTLADRGNRAQIDLSLIDHCLSLTPEERLEAHEAARQLVKDLTEAGREFYARQS